jgi:glycosyltransferase involved in cell wall biosynthesis|tara:strand:+ start:2501 stop:3127 length:627 start_codon:yes stop_codon:yes gene_type:complete
MKITYGITVHNEHKEIEKLLKFLVEHRDEGDEIVICDDHSDYQCWRVFDEYIHGQYPDIVFYEQQLNNDFSRKKNSVIEKSTGDYIFHLDADEIPHKVLMSQLKQILEINDVDLIWIPRINTVDGITQEHIDKWRWSVTEKGWINFPDYQSRVFRNRDDIRWEKPVHEIITGCKTYSHLPPHEELCIYHPKTIEKQEKQNELYGKIIG